MPIILPEVDRRRMVQNSYNFGKQMSKMRVIYDECNCLAHLPTTHVLPAEH